MEYDDFIQNNKEQGRLEEIMTWEYPDGSFWTDRIIRGGRFA
jgi:hypothetical protein